VYKQTFGVDVNKLLFMLENQIDTKEMTELGEIISQPFAFLKKFDKDLQFCRHAKRYYYE
jgi:hypothetical protein